jgi:hypothetical protein
MPLSKVNRGKEVRCLTNYCVILFVLYNYYILNVSVTHDNI